jgi:hypothetical protein
MKSIRLLLIAISFIVLSSNYSCGDSKTNETNTDSTVVSNDQVIEQTVDSSSLSTDTLKK